MSLTVGDWVTLILFGLGALGTTVVWLIKYVDRQVASVFERTRENRELFLREITQAQAECTKSVEDLREAVDGLRKLIGGAQEAMTALVSLYKDQLADYKVSVAKEYVSKIEHKALIDRLDNRFDRIDDKLDRNFKQRIGED